MVELLAMNVERILGWSSPIGLGLFLAGLGAFLFLASRAGGEKRRKEG